MKYPDAKKHQIISFIKSGIRILGYILIPYGFYFSDYGLIPAAGVLIFSEIIGIIEELV
jgi:hypothetical protein